MFIEYSLYLGSFKKHFITLFNLINLTILQSIISFAKKKKKEIVVLTSCYVSKVPQLDLRSPCFLNSCFDSKERIKPLRWTFEIQSKECLAR